MGLGHINCVEPTCCEHDRTTIHSCAKPRVAQPTLPLVQHHARRLQ